MIMRKLYEDWELAQSVGALIWACDGMDIPQRIEKFAAGGHEFRFSVGVHRDFVAEVMQAVVKDGEVAKRLLFAIPDKMRKSLQSNPIELRRRFVDSERGMKSTLIYSTMLREPDGGQCYLVFRRNRSNRCIVHLMDWS